MCISTLHVSLIIRVLPRAESAAGWHLPCSPMGSSRSWLHKTGCQLFCWYSACNRRCFRSTRSRAGSGLTALCELAVNIGASDEWLLCCCARFRPHVTCACYNHKPSNRCESPVGRPRVLMNCVGQGRQFAVCPLSRPLLAAFATIAAMIKCFNSIKNCYHSRHDDYCPLDPKRTTAGGLAGICRPTY
ncbi:hypothetical protein C1884_05605 [Pseudomonas sp. GW460-R15]|nr:hypothetical protein C1887_18855 [Pseudomonas sp. GW456-R21]POA70117.1 hypothetical protein C1884_05605 [Pseudomonas sp. GW460-R15]